MGFSQHYSDVLTEYAFPRRAWERVKLVTGFVTPPNSIWLGYVYLNQDSDGDGLIDGQEIILGTDINLVDTDGDSTPDGAEYPAAGVPVSDPRISDIIFANGFE